MKRFLPLILLFYVGISHGQISVDNSFTTQAQVATLIEDVLIGGSSTCASISNVTKRTGLNGDPDHEGMLTAPVNGIGSFSANGTNFPFSEGIILMSGDAAMAPGPNTTVTLSGGGVDQVPWDGDDDLNGIIGLSGVDPDDTYNATYVTFDFTPNINFIEFNFIFASEEYDGGTECGFNDSFAFILTDLVTGAVTNLAIVPGTTDPISTFTIRDLPDPPPCPDVNPSFFDKYNLTPGLMPGDPDPVASSSLIAFNGQTVPLTAQSNVVSGRTYNIKLVVADQGDAVFDIGVFLEAGSFKIGVDLGDDLTVMDDTALCDGDTTTFDASPGTTSTTGFEWQYFDTVSGTFQSFVPPELSPMLTVGDPGEYKVIVTFDSGCTGEDTVVVEIFNPPIGTDTTDTVCSDLALAHDLNADVTTSSTFVWKAIDNPDPNVTGEQTIDTPGDIIDDSVTNTSSTPQVVRYEVIATGTGQGMCPAVLPFFVDVTVNPEPQLATNLATTVCSGEDAEITLDVSPTSAPATTYNLISVTPENPSVIPMTGNAVIGNGFASTHIFSDAFTNQTFLPLWVEYVVAPVSAFGCIGDPVTFRLTVDPEPIMSASLNTTVCSDTPSGIVLATNNSAVGAASYNIDINFNGLTPSAGGPVVSGTGNDRLAIADDAYTNTGNLPVVVTYTVVPVSLAGCFGAPLDVLLTVDPEPVVANNLDTTVCSAEATGLVFNTNGISVLATSYNLISVTPSAGLTPAPGNVTFPSTGLDNMAANDIFFNLTATIGFVDYLVEGVSAIGCVGDEQTIRVTIDAQPVLATNLDAAVCSDDPSSIILSVETGSVPAASYNITAINNPGMLVQSAGGTTTIGNGYSAAEIADDAFTNTVADTFIEYTIAPVSADGCVGEEAIVSLTVLIDPLIVVVPELNICDDAADGSDTNGFARFNLTDRTTDILGGQTNVDLAYFEDAALTIPITTPSDYYSDTTIIFVALTRNDVPQACSSVNMFDIIVRPKPVILTAQASLVQCDTDIDGFSAFNLTEAEQFISADYLNETFTYFDPTGAAIPDPTNYTNQTATTEIVSVTATTMFGCERNSTILLEVDTSSIPAGFLLEYSACDTDFDEDAIFDFSNATAQVLALFPPGQILIVSYYETQADALAETNAIMNIGNFENDPALTDDITGIQPIWVRVDGDSANDCQGLGIHINLEVLGNPPLEPVTDLIECRDTPGTFNYDLTQKDLDISAGDPTVQVFYYDNLADYNATPPVPLPAPANYMTSSINQVIYYSSMNAAGCTTYDDTLSFQLIVNPNPEINDISDYDLCGEGSSGTVTLDLSLNDPDIILGNTEIVAVTYHTTQMGAETGDMSIPDATSHTTTAPSPLAPYTETVWIRVTDIANSCYKIIDFDINILLSPAVVSPAPYEICDEDNDGFAVFVLGSLNDEIFAGDPTLTIEYYYTQSDAETAPDDISLRLDQVAFTNILPYNDSVWARVENSADCETIIEVFLVVLDAPTPNTNPDPYVLCDTNNDGVEIFDLTSRAIEILDGLDPTIYDIVWYSDEITANDISGIEPASDIADEVNYVSGTMLPLPAFVTVYARVINTTQSPTTRCFEVVTLELEVQPIPTPDQPEAYELCDDLASGSTTDEISIFDLRYRDVIITGGTATWNVTYYFSELEAEVGDPTTWLADMYPNAVPASQTIWARVQDTNTGCFATVSQTLVINPNPSPTSIPPVEVCDLNPLLGDTTADNSGLFDLTDIASQIENGETNVTTIFYQTLANANDEMSPITTDPYQSISGSIWGRVQNDNTACFTVVEVELLVNPSPVISDPLPELTACDDDADLEAIFDLTLNEAAIYGSQTPADYNLTYHTSQASAEAVVGSALDSPIAMATLMNYTSASATIWVRLENIATGCTNTGSFAITVAPTPAYTPPPATFFACDTTDSGSDTDGITSFDLTLITDEITSSNPDLIVTYYVNAVDIPASPIPTPAAYQGTGADPQTIFIVIESTTAGMCSVQEVIDLRVNALPVLISDPLPNAVGCDPDNDGFTTFDLMEYSDLILDGQTGISLSFFEVEQDAIDNTTANAIDISVDYNNISGMTTLYVRAESVDNMPENSLACAKVFAFELEAHPTPILPAASIDLSITDCDLDGDDGELIDLTVNEAVILAAQDPAFSYIITYHESSASAADLADMGIADPTNHLVTVAASPATIYYRILFDDGSECITIGNFEVTVGALPAIMDPTAPLEVCDDDDDEIALFDLTSIIDDLTFSNPLLQVDFYESQAVIDAGGFAIPEDQLESYSNVSNPQLMQIIVTSLEGCTAQTQLTLRVLPLPSPDNSNPDPIIVCDDDFDGFYTFDNTSVENLLDKADEIDASVAVIIEMFESLEDAENYDPATNTPTPINQTSYTNSIPNGQTIYARVGHDPAAVPGNDCFVIVTFDLIINPLPVINPDIIDPYVFCEQEDGDDSVGILNLDIIASEIGLLAPPQQEADFNITYHLAQSQAENDAFALTSPYEYTEAPAPNNGLWIRVENKVSGCYVLVFEEIIVEARPVATTPEPMMACEVIEPDPALPNGIPLAGVGEFDLTTQNEVINDGPLDADTQVNYFTSEADALSNSNAITDPDIFFNTSNPQTIWAVTQNTLTTCASSPPVFFEISVKATPYTDLSQEGGDICVDPTTGEVLDPITLDATPETVVTGASYSYLWYLNGGLFSQDPVIQVTQTGDYTVEVTATYSDITTGMITSCSYLAGANYTPISAPLFEVEVLEDSFNSSGLYTVQVIDSSISGFGAADYEFAIDDGPFQSGLTFTNVSPGDHIVYGRRVDGNCEATPVEVGIIDYPRFFTPNQDGFHDTWNIYGLGSAPNLNAKIFIFDRYGKLLKQLSPTSPGWNGTYNGQPVPSTDYWFRVEFTEPDGVNEGNQRTFTGHFALKR